MRTRTDPSQPVPLPGDGAEEEDVQAASLVANSTFTLAARVYGVAAGAVVALLVVRTLSVDEYGRYALAMAVILLMGSLAELGMSALVIRQVAAEPASAPRVLGVALLAQLCTAVPAAALTVPIGLALGYSSEVVVLLAIGCGVVLTQGALAVLNGAFQARRRFSLFAATSVAQATVLVAGTAAVLLAGAGAKGLVAIGALAYVAASLSALYLVGGRLHVKPRLGGSLAEVPAFLRAALPVAATAATAVVYGRIDVLLLASLDSERAVAIYNLPLTLVEITFLIPAAIAVPFFPLFTKQLEDDIQDARQSFDLIFRLFLLGSVPIALVFALAGGDLLRLVFGEPYRASGTVLVWLSATVVFNFLIYLFWYALLAAHKERGRMPALLAGLVLNVAANVILVPRYGPPGAGAALALTDALMVAWLAVVVRRGVVHVPLGRRLTPPLLALAAAVGVGLAAGTLGDIARAVLAALVYVGALVGTRYVSAHEWQPLAGPLLARIQSRRNR